MEQDSAGYLWIGTENGLYRFDGQNCSSYFNEKNDSTTLTSNNINKLFVDHNKKLWVATKGGLCKYNPVYNNFTRIITDTDLKGLPGSDISVINEDKLGNLFLAYWNGVFEWDKTSQQFKKIAELKSGKINRLLFDDQNNIWIAASDEGGLFYYDRRADKLEAFGTTGDTRHFVSNGEIMDIALVNKRLWIATYGAGIDCFDLNSRTIQKYSSANYFENYASSIFPDHRNQIWVCTLGSLKLYDPKSDSFFNYYYDPNNPESLGKSLTGFFEDNQHNYWTMHSPGGLRYSLQGNPFKHFNPGKDEFWNTSDKNITAIAADGNGNLWIGNFYNGIDVFNWQSHRIDRYWHKNGDQASLGNGTIFSIFKDSKDQIWVGSNLGGLQKFNPGKNNFESFVHHPDDSLSIAGNDVRSITEDADGYLWLAVHGKGVDRFDPVKKTFTHYNSRQNRLSNDYTFQVLFDSNRNLWVASAYGLNLLARNEKMFRNFFYDKSDSTTISNNVIQTIYEDQQHTLWFGTPDGLNKYNPANQSFTSYTKELTYKNVRAILGDRGNNIWYSSDSGISRFNPSSLTVRNFDQNDGLQSRIFNERSCFTGDHAELFFGGSEGIDSFNPDSLNFSIQPPKVMLTGFRVFNKPVDYKTDKTVIDKYIAYASQINLDYGSNSVSFDYQAINFNNPEKISYAVKLDGFDKEWVDAGTRNEASYTNLRPGKYIFMVKARYNNGDWNKKITSVNVIISRAWWMSYWFLALVAIILLVAPFLVVHLRTKLLLKQRKTLENQVAERTLEIQRKNELLHEMNATKIKLFSIISHDLRSPFNSILGFHDLLVSDYDDLTDEEKLDILKQLQTSSRQVYALVENLLSWSRLQTDAIQYRPISFSLKQIVHEKVNLYRTMAEDKGIKIGEYVDENMIVFADPNLVRAIIGNLINNSVKFTAAGGTITIQASTSEKMVKIEIADNGVGMSQEQLKNLFDLERMEVKTGTHGEKGTGLGLLLCKDFVGMNHGMFSVTSETGKGSVFSFTLPTAQ